MAIKEISYSVSVAGISPATEQHGGTQSEHRAVKLTFNLNDDLREKITAQAESGKAVYRFDAYDGENNVVPGAPQELGADTVPEFYLEEWLTRAGGRIRVYLVITVIVNENTEMELYSFPARLVLNNLPNANLLNDADNLESVSVVAQNAIDAAKEAGEVSHSAKEVADSANDTAQKASKTAQSVRDDADNGVFKGEQGERGPSGVYVGSGDMPEDCNVQIDPNGVAVDAYSLATKEYVDERLSNLDPDDMDVDLSNYPTREEMQQAINPLCVDYIVDQGTSDIWTWEKWNSGTIKMWCKINTTGANEYIATAGLSYPTGITLIERGCAFVTINYGFNHTSFGLDINAKAVAKETLAEVFVHKCSGGLTEDNSSISVSLFIIGRWK